MIKRVIRWVTHDNEEFKTQEEAVVYQSLLVNAEKCKSKIIKQYDFDSEIGLLNSQDNIDEFNRLFRVLLSTYACHLLEKWDNNPRGIIGRVLSDSDYRACKILHSVYYHGVMCVGKDGKSYGQPCYATKTFKLSHPAIVRINPPRIL